VNEPPAPEPKVTLSPKRKVFSALILSFFTLIALFLALGIPAAREKAREEDCLSNIHGIGFACGMYADSNDGKLPHNFADLKGLITSTKLFICPSARDQIHYSYELTGATNVFGVDSSVVILREIEPNHHGKRNVLYDDGHAELVADKR
jgi:hypothetical protein